MKLNKCMGLIRVRKEKGKTTVDISMLGENPPKDPEIEEGVPSKGISQGDLASTVSIPKRKIPEILKQITAFLSVLAFLVVLYNLAGVLMVMEAWTIL